MQPMSELSISSECSDSKHCWKIALARFLSVWKPRTGVSDVHIELEKEGSISNY